MEGSYNTKRMSIKELEVAKDMFEEDLIILEEEAEFVNKLLQDTYLELDRRNNEHTK